MIKFQKFFNPSFEFQTSKALPPIKLTMYVDAERIRSDSCYHRSRTHAPDYSDASAVWSTGLYGRSHNTADDSLSAYRSRLRRTDETRTGLEKKRMALGENIFVG